MVSRQLDNLDTSAVKEGIVSDEEGVRPLARKRFKRRIDLAAGACAENVDLQSLGASSRVRVS